MRAGEHSTGLVADELIGSREIVVKPVGPQISAIRGISGATILSDGRVVIILDITALVRAEWRVRAAAVPLREAREIFERDYLVAQINRFGGNISRTAEFVGMERSALHRKLKSLGVVTTGKAAGRGADEEEDDDA